MQVGDLAKYRNTGTVGKVLDIEQEGEVSWVHLDTSDLYYDMSTLDKAGPDEYRGAAEHERNLKEQLEDVERLREQMQEATEKASRITPSGAG